MTGLSWGDPISLILQVQASIVTLWAIWQMGNKSLWGPSLSLVSDAAFLTLDVYLHLWGLIPFCVALVVIHLRNLIKWRADARETAREEAVRAAALHGDHRERRSPEANEGFAGRLH